MLTGQCAEAERLCRQVLKEAPRDEVAAYQVGLARVCMARDAMSALAATENPRQQLAAWWVGVLTEAFQLAGVVPGSLAAGREASVAGASAKWREDVDKPDENVPTALLARHQWVRLIHWLAVSPSGRLAAFTWPLPREEGTEVREADRPFGVTVIDLDTGKPVWQKTWLNSGVAFVGEGYLCDGRVAEVWDIASDALLSRKFTGGIGYASPAPWVRLAGEPARFVRVYHHYISGWRWMGAPRCRWPETRRLQDK